MRHLSLRSVFDIKSSILTFFHIIKSYFNSKNTIDALLVTLGLTKSLDSKTQHILYTVCTYLSIAVVHVCYVYVFLCTYTKIQTDRSDDSSIGL